MDLLFGLDMLKAHQAVIDLEKNALRIQGREVKFLAEHELPDKARADITIEDEPSSQADASRAAGPSNTGGQTHLPGVGSRLGPSSSTHSQPSPSTGGFPESSIKTLMDLGATREEAVRTLQAAGGNVDYAASLLF